MSFAPDKLEYHKLVKTSSKGGVRVPLILTSTKRELKQVKNVLNHVTDWFPTILELAKAKESDSDENELPCLIFGDSDVDDLMLMTICGSC